MPATQLETTLGRCCESAGARSDCRAPGTNGALKGCAAEVDVAAGRSLGRGLVAVAVCAEMAWAAGRCVEREKLRVLLVMACREIWRGWASRRKHCWHIILSFLLLNDPIGKVVMVECVPMLQTESRCSVVDGRRFPYLTPDHVLASSALFIYCGSNTSDAALPNEKTIVIISIPR